MAGLQLILRNRRTGVDAYHGRIDIEAGEGPLDQLDVRLDLVVEPLLADGDGIEQAEVGLHPDPLDLILDEGRRSIIAVAYDRQNGLSDGDLLPARCGRHLILG